MNWHNKFRLLQWIAILIIIFTASASRSTAGRRKSLDDQTLRLRTNVVSVSVTVTGKDGRFITGLRREDFEVYENKVRQHIEYFSDVDQPATIGIIFDVSGSMQSRFEKSREALKHFIETSHPQDEYFLLSFNDRISRPLHSGDGNDLLRQLNGLTPNGKTALYDAIYAALDKLQQSRHRQRALLIISDGVDNHSRYGLDEIRHQLREADVKVYVIGSPEPASTDCGRLCQFEAKARLERLSEMSGGKAFFPHSFEQTEKAVSHIALELRRQYNLGYIPTAHAPDGKWRQIKVRVNSDNIKEKISVRAREGYYATP